MNKKNDLKKYNFKAWTIFPCQLLYEQTGPLCEIDCDGLCGENEDEHPCKEIIYVATNSKFLFYLKLFLYRFLYDYVETEENV